MLQGSTHLDTALKNARPSATAYLLHTAEASIAYGYSLHRLWLQPPPPMVTASIAYGYSPHCLWLQPLPPMVTGGALKNIVALGAGFCDGLGLGGNTKVTKVVTKVTRVTKVYAWRMHAWRMHGACMAHAWRMHAWPS